MNKTVVSLLFSVSLVTGLSGCITKPDDELARDAGRMLTPGQAQSASDAEEQAQMQVPDGVRQQLRAGAGGLSDEARALLAEPRFSVQARDIDARDFFAQLTEQTPYSMVLHPEVSGTISMSLNDVTLADALQVAEDIYGYDIRRQGRIYRVYPADMRTETMQVNYLALKRYGTSQTSISSGGVAQMGQQGQRGGQQLGAGMQGGMPGMPMGQAGAIGGGQMNRAGQSGTEISTSSETDFWEELKGALAGVVGEGEGRRISVSPQAGLVTVRAFPGEIRAARDFLDSAQQNLQRQVILEARIVEVSLNDQYEQGVDWSRITSRLGDGLTEVSFGGGGNIGGAFSASFNNQTFDGMLQMLSTQGNVQVLSSPRVTATNNQKAVIKIGEDEYFVTDVSTTTITGTATTSTPNVQLTPFFSGIALDVTPQIGEDGDVILHVHPSVTETTEQMKTITLNEERLVLPLAQSNIRETDTIIRARNGEVVVIGGLMQTSYTDVESKVPILGDIPILGALFSQRTQREQKKELVIMLRPIVVGADTWREELERSNHLLQDWYGVN
ncbi:pilus (MSHA type) biogenesis protein MshL [Aliidiomarina minuta]|uniref:Pilus (MSHA type) biogenesis protein MshL n=1 Tax=Aliidiomarina minuta TaxID=880057 RepID=A0A432W9N1_9GAMM|nr:pilus (MSHA type) biogenesis protein MshL [Aliidiomarina minuta]RUO26686.1 pilus (MSHA type) biogenesis protein MshL [Aliidiomarina minuta]